DPLSVLTVSCLAVASIAFTSPTTRVAVMSGSPASVAVDGCWVWAQIAGPAGAAKSRTVAAKKSALIILLSRYSLKNTACYGFMTINVIWKQDRPKASTQQSKGMF